MQSRFLHHFLNIQGRPSGLMKLVLIVIGFVVRDKAGALAPSFVQEPDFCAWTGVFSRRLRPNSWMYCPQLPYLPPVRKQDAQHRLCNTSGHMQKIESPVKFILRRRLNLKLRGIDPVSHLVVSSPFCNKLHTKEKLNALCLHRTKHKATILHHKEKARCGQRIFSRATGLKIVRIAFPMVNVIN